MGLLDLKAPSQAGTTTGATGQGSALDPGTPQWSVFGQLTSPVTHPWAIVGETILLPLIAVGIGLWLNPDDPLWIHASFPWAWFAPIVLALRYGPLTGIGGAAMLLLVWLALNLVHPAEFPKLVFLGGLILVMVIGEFSSLWLARARRAEAIQRYLDQRLEFLTHQYYLLRLSHDRLEQDLISRPMAMRDALGAMRNHIATEQMDSDSAGASALLRLLAQYCQLEVAALHYLVDERLQTAPIATLGNTSPLQADDPLIEHAMQTSHLCHIAQSLNQSEQSSRYLIAAPLNNLDGKCFGLLLVEQMPFFSLQDETLQTINLLLGYYADSLSMHALAAQIRRKEPDCPPEFAFELQRLWHIRQSSQVSSVVVALEIQSRPGMPDVAQQIQRQKRALDENWLIQDVDRSILATLMPLSGQSAAEGYLSRLEMWAHQKSGQTLAEFGIFGHILPLDTDPPLVLLQRLNEIAHASAQTRPLRPHA